MTITPEKVITAIKIIEEIHEIIKLHGPAGIPSGHLYAALMPHIDISLETYQGIINFLVRAKKIKVVNHLITAVPQATP
jgi:radical SAM superfamily enzyme